MVKSLIQTPESKSGVIERKKEEKIKNPERKSVGPDLKFAYKLYRK
jgi:hypothetical protein